MPPLVCVEPHHISNPSRKSTRICPTRSGCPLAVVPARVWAPCVCVCNVLLPLAAWQSLVGGEYLLTSVSRVLAQSHLGSCPLHLLTRSLGECALPMSSALVACVFLCLSVRDPVHVLMCVCVVPVGSQESPPHQLVHDYWAWMPECNPPLTPNRGS